MLKDKIIIIGGSGSIGSAIAKEVMNDGFEPYLIGRNYSSLENAEISLANVEPVEETNNKKIVVVENRKIKEKWS